MSSVWAPDRLRADRDRHVADRGARVQESAGQSPANVAVGLARLGVASAFMGKVGDDPFGHFLAHTLAQAGVDTAPLCFTDQARTALAFVSLRADEKREFMFYRPSADMPGHDPASQAPRQATRSMSPGPIPRS
jgi:sugar/nucleoside kinase (ribokinase family)